MSEKGSGVFFAGTAWCCAEVNMQGCFEPDRPRSAAADRILVSITKQVYNV